MGKSLVDDDMCDIYMKCRSKPFRGLVRYGLMTTIMH